MNGGVHSLLFFILLCSCNSYPVPQSSTFSAEAHPGSPVNTQPKGQSRAEDNIGINVDIMKENCKDKREDHRADDKGLNSDKGLCNGNTNKGRKQTTIKEGASGNGFDPSATSSNSEVVASTEETATSYLGELTLPPSRVQIDPATDPAWVKPETVGRNFSKKASKAESVRIAQGVSDNIYDPATEPGSVTPETVGSRRTTSGLDEGGASKIEKLDDVMWIVDDRDFICFGISIFFLTITIFCHMSTPALHTGRHRYTLSHMISALLGNIFLIVAKIVHRSLQEGTCVAVAILIHFTYMATFSWMNVMCFDIWLLARQQARRSPVRGKERCGWLQYCISAVYGWGVPIAISLMISIQYHAPSVKLITLDFDGRCFFKDDLPTLLFLYGPITSMVAISLLLLLLAFRSKPAMNTIEKDSEGKLNLKVFGASVAKWGRRNKRKEKTSAPETNEVQSGTGQEGGQETTAPTRNPDDVSEVCGQKSPPTPSSIDQTPPKRSDRLRVHSKVNFQDEYPPRGQRCMSVFMRCR